MTIEKGQTIKPIVKLSGTNGNAFAIISRVRQALKRANYKQDDIKKFTEEATQGDYDNALQTCMKWVDVV